MPGDGISWKVAAKPAGNWLIRLVGKWLPSFVFRKFYTPEQLKRDVLVGFSTEEPTLIILPANFRVPRIDFPITIRNASPYLDIQIPSITIALRSADCFGGQGGALAERVEILDRLLLSGDETYCRVTFFLNEFQVRILREHLNRHARLEGFLVVLTETVFGKTPVFAAFDLNKLCIQQVSETDTNGY